MKILLCFCVPLAISGMVHVIQYPTTMLSALTLRAGRTKMEVVALFAGAWLELASLAFVTAYIVTKFM